LLNSKHEEVLRSDSNQSSEKNDYNSAGQDVANSMMSLLLPQAVPLLRNVSTDKKFTSMVTNSKEEQNEVGCVSDVPSSGKYTYPCYFNFSWHRSIHHATWVFEVPFCLLNPVFVLCLFVLCLCIHALC
jgi:hypothetical protein